MSEQQQGKPSKDIAHHSVSAEVAEKSVSAIDSSENVSLSECSSDSSVVAGHCASPPIVASSAAPITSVVKPHETTFPSGPPLQAPNDPFKAPFVNIASVDVSQNSSSNTLDVSSVTTSNKDSPYSVLCRINSGSAHSNFIGATEVEAIDSTSNALAITTSSCSVTVNTTSSAPKSTTTSSASTNTTTSRASTCTTTPSVLTSTITTTLTSTITSSAPTSTTTSSAPSSSTTSSAITSNTTSSAPTSATIPNVPVNTTADTALGVTITSSALAATVTPCAPSFVSNFSSPTVTTTDSLSASTATPIALSATTTPNTLAITTTAHAPSLDSISETGPSSEEPASVAGVSTVLLSTPLSAPRRSSRARRINSRLDLDEVDENIKKFVARIAAPDSHSILQSPELAFHSPAPHPPPPPAPCPPKTSSDQTGEQKVNAKKHQKKIVKRLQAVVDVEKSKKETTADFTSHRIKGYKKNNQDVLKTEEKSISGLDALESDSDDDLPLAHFTSTNTSAFTEEKVLTPISSKSKRVSNSKTSSSFPSKYCIKTIHDPELSSTPISIVCIEDPEEEDGKEFTQNSKKKVKKKIPTETISSKKRKGTHVATNSKMNGMDGVKGSRKPASTKASSKVKQSKKFEIEKLKKQLNATQGSTGKLLKIVNLKVVPSSLPDLSSSNVLRKLIQKSSDSDTSEKVPSDQEKTPSLEPDRSMCVETSEVDTKVSPQKTQPKTENFASKYDNLKAVLHADELSLSSSWSQEQNDKSGCVLNEHKPCNTSLDKSSLNIQPTFDAKEDSLRLDIAANALSSKMKAAGVEKSQPESPRAPLKLESVEVSHSNKRPLLDHSISSNKKVKHERNSEKVVFDREQLDKESCNDFTSKYVEPRETDTSKESFGCNLTLVKADPCERKPDLAMVRDTRIQCESNDQEKEIKLNLTPQKDEKNQDLMNQYSTSQPPKTTPLRELASSASKSSPRRSRTSSPSETRHTKRIKVSPVDSKEDIKPELLMTKIIEGTGIESKPDLLNFKMPTECSSPKKLRECEENSSTSKGRSFKEEPRESSDLLHSSSSSASSPSDSPVCGHSTSTNNMTENVRYDKYNESLYDRKDRSCNDDFDSSFNNGKHISFNDSEGNVKEPGNNPSDVHETNKSIDEKFSSFDGAKETNRYDKKDDQNFLHSKKESISSEKKDSSRNDKKETSRSRDTSREDRKESSRSERKESSRNEKYSSNHKSFHSSRDKYSGSSSSRSSSSSKSSSKKSEGSSHKSRHESSRSKDQKSSRKDSDGRRDNDSRDRTDKDRSRKSDDKKREYHEKRDKSFDTSEGRSSSELASAKIRVKSEALPDISEANKNVLPVERPTKCKSPDESGLPPRVNSLSKDVSENINHVKEEFSNTCKISVHNEPVEGEIEIGSSMPVSLSSEVIRDGSNKSQQSDAKLSLQEAASHGALISSTVPSEIGNIVTSQSHALHSSIQVKTENNSEDDTVTKDPPVCTANDSQVEYKIYENLLSNTSGESQSEPSNTGTDSIQLETKPSNADTSADATSTNNIRTIFNMCRANVPTPSSEIKIPLKTEETEERISFSADIVETSLSGSTDSNTRNMNSIDEKSQETLRPPGSSEKLLTSNCDLTDECRISSRSPTGEKQNSDVENTIKEGKMILQEQLSELGNHDDKDNSLDLINNQLDSSRGQLVIRLEDIDQKGKLTEIGYFKFQNEFRKAEESIPVDSMDVDGAGVFSDSKENTANVKVTPLHVVEETPEEKEKRLEEERRIAIEKERRNKIVVEERMKSFVHLTENLYLIDRKKSKQSKEVRRMVCDCFLTKEEISRGEKGCGEDCLNRLLMIECGWRCPLGDACLNRQFQRCDYGPVEVFNAEEKGCGVRATGVISPGTFIMEYVGEVFDQREFRRRRKDYGKDGTAHFYFMALRADQFIDATRKGNISRFVNHSCDPNAETQKWTVNGELRIGFFATKFIAVGEEINFDYRMERYGREPQKCYCGTAVCRGWLGEPPDEKTKEEKEEERKRLASSDKRKKEDKKHYDDELLDDVSELARVGLRNKRDTLLLSRVMVRAETDSVRLQLLTLLCAASANMPCLRLFMDYHGLSLLWSWMADLSTALQHAPLKLQILKTLDILPITNRTQVSDSRVLEMVEKWSKQLPPPPASSAASSTITTSDGAGESSVSPPSDARKSSDGEGFEETDDSSQQSSDDNSKQGSDDNLKPGSDDSNRQGSDDNNKQSPDDNNKQMLSPDDNSSDSNCSAVKNKSSVATVTPTPDATSSSLLTVEEDSQLRKVQLEMVELALKLLERWKVLKEEFRIPKKQRVELMKEHEREVEAGYRRYLNTERGKRETRESRYGRSSYDSRRGKVHVLDSYDKNPSWSNNDAISIMMNSEEFAGLSKEERREKFAQKVAQVDEQRRLQEGMWSVHVDRCARIGLDPYQSPIVDPSGQYYWDSSNSTWVPLTPETAYAAGILSPAVAQQHGLTTAMVAGFGIPGGEQPVPYDPHAPPVMNGEVLPPLVVTIKLPPHWHIARDQLNRVYFYHNRSRQTQWEIPTNETKTSIQISDSESDSTSSSSDSEEEFSSDEDEGNDDEVASATSANAAEDSEAAVEGKIIRRQRGKKKHSEALVQQRVISPIRELDRELARKERREAKERAKHEARKERHFHDLQLAANDEDGDDDFEGNPDDLLASRVLHHPARDKVKTKSKERAATAIADNSERGRKIKDLFRSRMATFIVSVLNPYRRADCKQGRINTTDDFKYLARKLTHFVMVKELKQLPSIEDLDCSESVKHKTKDFVRKYMAKYGSSFKRDPLDTKEY